MDQLQACWDELPIRRLPYGVEDSRRRKRMEPSIMTKSDTIEAIQRLNPTVRPDFLAEFSTDELVRYLDRLSGTEPVRCPENDNIAQLDRSSSVDAAV